MNDAKSLDIVHDEEWKKFLSYVAGFYSNTGNYHSFGDNKFIPDLTPEKFKPLQSPPQSFQPQQTASPWATFNAIEVSPDSTMFIPPLTVGKCLHYTLSGNVL